MRVVNRLTGRELEIEDGSPCPSGYSLKVPTLMMDSQQREVSDAASQAQRVRDSYAAFKGRLEATMHRHSIPTKIPDGVVDSEIDRRELAYSQWKARLGARGSGR